MATDSTIALFKQKFGTAPTWTSRAPGRVNLIGEHTDYNDGFVFPAAIDRYVRVAATVQVGESRLFSTDRGDGETFHTDLLRPGHVQGWVKYPAAVAWALNGATGQTMPGLRAVVESNIPLGSGVSSSAALELAFAVLWNEVAELGFSLPELARICQRAENEFIGVKCGIMDQLASAMGLDHKAMFIDTRSLDIEYANIPADWAIVVCNTKKPRALSDSAYNERRAQCQAAAKTLGVASLRDADLSLLEARRSELTPVQYRRARHVITENARCLVFREALGQGDEKSVGELMQASHLSLRDDYEVSCRELDVMSEAAWEAPGCIGARMTGAGFGGCCVALVKADKSEEFIEDVRNVYESAAGRKGEWTVCAPAEGARCAHV